MERFEVKSSTIHTIGFDAKAKILEVTFNSGATYQYTGVSKEVADAFLNAESKGSHFAIHIRPCFPFERLHGEGCGKYLECKVVNCECFCHKTKEAKREIPNPNLEKELKKSIKAAKSKKRQPI